MPQTSKIYCLSGLGVDERAFSRIEIQQADLIHVPWIPSKKRESLQAYATRLFETIQPDENYHLIGVSFGGMIAQEWAKILNPKKLILMSTAASNTSIKPLLRFPGKLGLHRLLHPKIALMFFPITQRMFGARTVKDKQQLKIILRDTDPKFLRWATGAILKWNASVVVDAIHIHGKNDKMISLPECPDLITEGGHFTVFSEGVTISKFIEPILEEN